MRDFVWLSEDDAIPCHLGTPGQSMIDGIRPHCHIIIRSPGAQQRFPGCGNTSLWLAFHDLDPEVIRRTGAFADEPAKGEQIIAECMTPQQALDLATFVKRTPQNAVIVVNCEAGISRSPGVCLALRRHFGGDTEECYRRAHPNIHVTNLVTAALNVPA